MASAENTSQAGSFYHTGRFVAGVILQITFSWRNLHKNIDEIYQLQHAQLNDVETLTQALMSECESNNTLRNYLLLPARNCNFFAVEDTENQKKETTEDALYFYTTLLKSNLEREEAKQKISEFIAQWNTATTIAPTERILTPSAGVSGFLETWEADAPEKTMIPKQIAFPVNIVEEKNNLYLL